jgi:DNA-binding transcriptional LysR family regulator
MNLAALQLFCDVVRCRSFSQAATMNNISQSAASQAVMQLEKELGVQLVDRTKRPFILTPEGEIYYNGFSDMLSRYEATQADIRSLREEVAGMVRVAAIYSIGLHEMRTCMQDFMSRYPKARVKLQYLLPARVVESVLNGEVDLGVMSYPTATRDIAVIPLRSEQMVLVCHPQHHLADRKEVSIKDLQGENFIAFDRELAICKELDRHLREHQVTVRRVMEFDNIETIKQAIEIGAGISVLPAPTIRREVAAHLLAAVPITDDQLERPIGIIHRQRKTLTPIIRKFIDVLEATDGQGANGAQAEGGDRPAAAPAQRQ